MEATVPNELLKGEKNFDSKLRGWKLALVTAGGLVIVFALPAWNAWKELRQKSS